MKRLNRPDLPVSLVEDKKVPAGSYYTEVQQQSILSSFAPKPDFDDREFFAKLEKGADFYVNWRTARPFHQMKPSEAARQFRVLQETLSKLIDELVDGQRHADRNKSRRIARLRAKGPSGNNRIGILRLADAGFSEQLKYHILW